MNHMEDQQKKSTDELYSILAYIPHDENLNQHLQKLSDAYSRGVKLFLLLDMEHPEDLYAVWDQINSVMKEKNLSYDGHKLNICIQGDERIKKKDDGDFEAFNVFVYPVDVNKMFEKTGISNVYFEIENGKNIRVDWKASSQIINKILSNADQCSDFNFKQYAIEHLDIRQNILVRAGAGTGKTHVMIARIAYLCYTQRDHLEDMIDNIVMLTFTNAAATQMKDKIKEYFYNYYLLTGKSEYLLFISQIEKMQISTIHAYAKKMVNQLGFEMGYGNNISLSSSSYQLKQIIAKEVDCYINEALAERADRGKSSFLESLNLQIYQINDAIFEIISQLRNQSVNVAELNTENFWRKLPPDQKERELHKLIAEVVPRVEIEDNLKNRQDNRVQLGNLMSVLSACVRDEKNKQRISDMRTGRQRFMFVDEFQDTDNVQIDTLKEIAEALEYTLFVVGDVKQCIYRFRGATEDAFKRLFQGNDKKELEEIRKKWTSFSLQKNYRTDRKLLEKFHQSFEKMGETTEKNGRLLDYGEEDKLTGVRQFNNDIPVDSYYHRILIKDTSQDARMDALFKEIARLRKMENEEIAILVRENWQSEVIRQEGKKRKIEIFTNTSGDLYESEPALDMLKLANALLHFDEPDYLYSFASSNFIPGSINKANLYAEPNPRQDLVKLLTSVINEPIKNDDLDDWTQWDDILKALRTEPILQVFRRIYQIFKPWINYAPYDDQEEDKEKKKNQQLNYRLNVDLLFEELMRATNTDSLSVHALVDFLFRNIIAHTNVDSRVVDTTDEESKGKKKPGEPVIKCLTVHKAKGLEYDAVILPYCSADMGKMKDNHVNISVEGSGRATQIGYKLKDSIHNDFYNYDVEKNEQEKEEARILYVAMTRAKQWFSWIALENNTGSSYSGKGNRWQDFILGENENAF